MTLPYNEEVVNEDLIDCGTFEFCKFIGYLNKDGEAIDYSRPFGLGGHDSNPTTNLFLDYFRINDKEFVEREVDIIGDKNIKNPLKGLEYEKYECEQYRNKLKKMIINIKKDKEWQHKNHRYIFPIEKLEQDIIMFFYNCYQNDCFMTGFGKEYYIMNENEFYNSPYYQKILKKYPKKKDESEHSYNWRIPAIYNFDYMYWNYRMKIILGFFKDTLVQYLGYHSVERIPKTITTSEINIYSTFYNYLLNDFTIVQIPKMIYSDAEKKYIEYNQGKLLLSDKELRLKEEIQSIKRLVPLKDRHKYFI